MSSLLPKMSTNCAENDDYSFEEAPKSEEISQTDRHAYNEVLLQRLKCSLSGIPPPPILTRPQQKVEDVLQIWKNSSNVISNEKAETKLNYFRITCSMETALNTQWPAAKCCSFFDINYNLGELSEKIVELFDKYRERYVGCETSSFIRSHVLVEDSLSRKTNKRLIGRSPGRRLSHLARRRTTFSSESLQAVSNARTFGVEKKVISLDTNKDKKSKVVNRALFHSSDEIKTKSEGKGSSKLKSMQLRHSLWLKKKTIKGTPRKTPNKRTPKKATPRKRNTPKKLNQFHPTCDLNDVKMFTNDAYEMALSENGKRLRLESDCGENTKLGDLSDSQRKKLLWAVSAALKKVGVNCTHKHFRECAKKLYSICKTFWISKSSNDLQKGTSERMLSLASEHVSTVVEQFRRAPIPEAPPYRNCKSNEPILKNIQIGDQIRDDVSDI